MNCLSWNIGHLAWQEQRYFLHFAQGQMPFPEINQILPMALPPARRHWPRCWTPGKSLLPPPTPGWTLTTAECLQQAVIRKGKPTCRIYGNLLQRVIYHYWYHIGENMAIRQMLGHTALPQFVGDIDGQAPYRVAS